MGSLGVRYYWVTSLYFFTFMHWRRQWHPTPVLLPGESQGRGEPGGLPSMGSHRVRHDWNDLAIAAAATRFQIHTCFLKVSIFHFPSFLFSFLSILFLLCSYLGNTFGYQTVKFKAQLLSLDSIRLMLLLLILNGPMLCSCHYESNCNFSHFIIFSDTPLSVLTTLWVAVESESEVAQLCSTLCDPMDCSLLCPWDFPGKSTGVGCHFLLQRIFPTQGSNLGFPHCRQMLYHLSHQGS